MVGKLTPTQRAAVKAHVANSKPIMVKPTSIPPKPPISTRILNRFIDWYSNLI